MSGYRQDNAPMQVDVVERPSSTYGLLWRGIRRPFDRELAISGGEWIVVHLQSHEVLAVLRDFVLSGGVRNSPTGIDWSIAARCPIPGQASRMYELQPDAMWLPQVLKEPTKGSLS